MYIYGYWSETAMDDDSKLNVFRCLQVGDGDAMGDAFNSWLVEHNLRGSIAERLKPDESLPYFWYEGDDVWKLYSSLDSGEYFFCREV